MWAMSFRRFKRLHARIAVHRAQAQLDMLDVIIAPNMDGNNIERLRNSIMRVINPMAGKTIETFHEECKKYHVRGGVCPP
jgi:hypothetical protein